MYKLICLFFILFPFKVFPGTLNGIFSSDGNIVVAVGDSGLIMKSTNQGTTWQEIYSNLSNLNSVFCIDKNSWLCTSDGKVYILTALNQLLLIHNFQKQIALNSIFFLNELNGFVCGSDGNIFRTSNGGLNWEISNNGIGKIDLHSVNFLSESQGYCVGANGKIFSTNDGGNSWILENTNVIADLLKIKYSQNIPIVCGKNGTLLIMKNNKWQKIDLKTSQDITSIAIDNLSNLHICGGNGFIRNNSSDDSFSTFEVNPSFREPTDIFYYDIYGWMVSSEGKEILRTTNYGTNWNFHQEVSFSYVWESKISGQSNGYGNTLCINPKNENIIYVMYTNKVFVSRDRGETWNVESTINTPYIARASSFFVHPVDTNVWIAAIFTFNDSPVIRSTNNGTTWNIVLDSVSIGSYTKPLEISLSNPNFVYYATNNKGFFRSTNRGETFEQISNYSFTNPCDVTTQYLNSNNILIADASYPTNDSSKVLKSTDGGFTWNKKLMVPINETPAITTTIYSPTTAFLDANELYKSTDFGNSWFPITSGFQTLWALDICREDPTAIITGKYNGPGFNSTNSGNTFNVFNLPSSAFAFSAVLYPQRNFAIAMFQNSVYKIRFYNNLSVGVSNNYTVLSQNFLLSQNYPNPFNSSTKIIFELKKLANIEIAIYDIKGREIEILINKRKPEGKFEIQFDSKNLASGVYFYSLKINGNTIDTKRMLIIK